MGGYASGVILLAEETWNNGSLHVSTGGAAEDVQVESSGDCYISSGGSLNNATINAGGYLHIDNSGTATAIKENGGYVDVQNGAEVAFTANTFSGVELVNASATVHSGTTANQTKLTSNSFLNIYDGGTANETAVGSDGCFYVCEGGTANNTDVNSGGYLWVSSRGIVAKTNVNSRGQLYVSSGATATEVTAALGAYLDFCVTSDTLITGTSNGSAFEIKEGAVNDGFTLEKARLELGTGVKAVNTTVNSGGMLYVSSGAIANGIVENGGSVDVEEEAEVSFVANVFSDLVLSNATATVHSGTTAFSTIASSGGRLRVYSDGIADGIEVNGGGSLWVASGGTATTIKENGGYVSVANGAIVSFESADLKGLVLLNSASIHSNTKMTSTTVSRGGLAVYSGGMADTTVLLEGRTSVCSGGVANNTIVYSRARLEISSGGVADNVDIKNRGSATVLRGGTLRGLKVSSGGTLELREGTLSGKIVIESGAYIGYGNGTLDFDISEITPDAEVRVNDLSAIRGNLQYTLTVGTQKSGSYALAEGALQFNSIITVLNTDGVQLGTLTAGKALTTEKATYTLVSFGESLSVDVESFVPAAPTVSADTTTATTQAVTVTAVFGEDCTVGEYSYDGKEWLAYTAPIVFTENGTVYFRGADAAGNVSEVTSYEVANIETVIPDTIKPTVSNAKADITEPTNKDVTVTADFADDVELAQSLYRIGETTEWTDYVDGVIVSENTTVYFKAVDAAGNESAVVTYTVSNIDIDAPTAPSGLMAVVSDPTVVLIWSPSTDAASGIKEYVVMYSNNGQEFIATVNNTNYVLTGLASGFWSWSVHAVDLAGNESIMTSGNNFDIAGAVVEPVSDVAPQTQTWEKAEESAQYIVEYSTDNFEHVVRVMVDSNSLDSFQMPAGNYQWRVKPEGDEDWTIGEPVMATATDNDPKLVKSNEDGNADVFFANPVGTWESCYVAQHVGSINDWAGTNEFASVFGKNKLADIIEGSTDANILLMTDDENGDTLFVDDIYTASPGNMAEQQARIAQIDEIRAGAGNDIVDMTSQKFEYIGNGLTIRGGEGNDTIWANKGDNWLFGDTGDDRIVGASKNDVIVGGIGNDRMHGGGGEDIFTFCDNWGVDMVEQLTGGKVTLWFAEGSKDNWDEATLTYTDGDNCVKVSGVTADKITLKFGDDGSAQFTSLTNMGAFFDATSERIFEESGKGILASL